LIYAAENPLSDAGSNEDLADELLGALTALGDQRATAACGKHWSGTKLVTKRSRRTCSAAY
jgi:hypothetical protein